MNNPVPNSVPTQQDDSWFEGRCSGSNGVFALGVVLLCFGAAITGRHETTMIGLALIVFSSLCEW